MNELFRKILIISLDAGMLIATVWIARRIIKKRRNCDED
jgi:hypothetical protein